MFWTLLFLGYFSVQFARATDAPDSLTPSLAILAPYDTVTEHIVGQKSKLELTIAFPSGVTDAVIIELLPSTNVTVMALGDAAVISAGNNLVYTNQSVVYHKAADSENDAFPYMTRGVFTMGNIENTNTNTGSSNHELKIQFEAIVMTTATLNDGDTHWVSAGVEYNNSYNVWIGQTSYVIKTTTPVSSKTATYTMTPVANTNMEVGSTMTLTLDVLMPYPSPDVAVEAVSLHDDASNTDLRVVSFVLVKAGNNFAPALDISQSKTIGANCSDDWAGSSRTRIELPTSLINKNSLEAGSAGQDDLLRFETLIYLKPDAPLGETYPIGLGVEVDSAEVWVAYINLTSIASTASSVAPVFALDSQTQNQSAYISGVIEIIANISTPETGLNTFMIEIETREKLGTANPGFLISQVTEKNKGQNVLCNLVNVTYASSDPANTGTNSINNKAIVYVSVSNFGTYTAQYGNQANDYQLSINVLPLAGLAQMNSDHIVGMKIDSGVEQTLEYNIAGEAPFDQVVNMTFNFFHNCTKSSLSRGAVFEFYLDMKTQRNSNPGPITVEFPVPTNLSESFFSLCNYEVVSVGSNVVCAIPSAITSASVITKLSNGDLDKVKLIIPGSCNLGLIDDDEADMIKVRMLTKIRDEKEAIHASSEQWFGIGASYSPTQVWVAQYKINIIAPEYYSGLAVVNGLVVDQNDLSGNTFPGVYGIEWSLDGISFNDQNIDWPSNSNNGSHDILMTRHPFITSYIGMKSTASCNTSCFIGHEFIVTELEDYIEIFNDADKSLLRNFSIALDGKNTTCFGLPFQGNRPPVFWARLNMTIMNVTFSRFELLVSGKGLSCDRHGGNRVLQVTVPDKFQVSYPTSSSVGKFHGDIKFCTLAYDGAGESPNSLCKYQCECTDAAQCEEVFVFIANSEVSPASPWELCEITAENY